MLENLTKHLYTFNTSSSLSHLFHKLKPDDISSHYIRSHCVNKADTKNHMLPYHHSVTDNGLFQSQTHIHIKEDIKNTAKKS